MPSTYEGIFTWETSNVNSSLLHKMFLLFRKETNLSDLPLLPSWQGSYIWQVSYWKIARQFFWLENVSGSIRSLSNHDDDGNKNLTNLHIWQCKTVLLHALHVHFSSFDILKTFSFSVLRREMTCFAVVWTTWAYDYKRSILSSYIPGAGSNLIPG